MRGLLGLKAFAVSDDELHDDGADDDVQLRGDEEHEFAGGEGRCRR